MHVFQMDVTRLLQSWIITGGTNSGIMKYVGEARAKYNPTVPLIGITPLGIVKGYKAITTKMCTPIRTDLEAHVAHVVKSSSTHFVSSAKVQPETGGDERSNHFSYEGMSQDKGCKGVAMLDSNHSHFIFTHNGQEPGPRNFGTETKTRADFESCIAANFPPHKIFSEGKVVGVIRPYQSGAPGREMEEYIWQTMQQSQIKWDKMDFKSTSGGGIPLVSICVQGKIFVCAYKYALFPNLPLRA